MTTFKPSNVVTRPTRHLVLSLLAAAVLLSACQPNDSLSADAQNNSRVSSVGSNDDNTLSAANDDTLSDVAPTYVEGVADVPAVNAAAGTTHCQNASIIAAFRAQQSDRQVKGCGTIIKTLPDDDEGSRHQKILVELDGVSPKHTLLLVHNIDLAPRVANVASGTRLGFYGEYIYNNKGGLIHWTHHDPAARHQGGWIESRGVRYQ